MIRKHTEPSGKFLTLHLQVAEEELPETKYRQSTPCSPRKGSPGQEERLPQPPEKGRPGAAPSRHRRKKSPFANLCPPAREVRLVHDTAHSQKHAPVNLAHHGRLVSPGGKGQGLILPMGTTRPREARKPAWVTSWTVRSPRVLSVEQSVCTHLHTHTHTHAVPHAEAVVPPTGHQSHGRAADVGPGRGLSRHPTLKNVPPGQTPSEPCGRAGQEALDGA